MKIEYVSLNPICQIDQQEIEQFIFAGKSYFTLLNANTKRRFTFRITKLAEKKLRDNKAVWFISVMTGTSNEFSFDFIGTIFDGTNGYSKVFRYSRKSKLSFNERGVQTFKWFFENRSKLPDKVQFYHAGKCGRCGKQLTVPKSIKSGYGPECMLIIDYPAKGVLA